MAPGVTKAGLHGLHGSLERGRKRYFDLLSYRCRNLPRIYVPARKTNTVQTTQSSAILVHKESSSSMSHWKLLFKKQAFIFLLHKFEDMD